MCNAACLEFGRSHLTPDDVRRKRVLEVGALNVNGSLRPEIEAFGPSRYVGVDVVGGPGVDEICDICELHSRFGSDSFDVVLSTEVLEHVRDWTGAISNLKRILSPDGVLVLTTRSPGFPYHGYPHDFWRFEPDDMRAIFSDLSLEALERDRLSPGVFVRARKTAPFVENDLRAFPLYSVVNERRCTDVSRFEIAIRRFKYKIRVFLSLILPARVVVRLIELAGGGRGQRGR
jgi:SAM-dependent methyltransferase